MNPKEYERYEKYYEESFINENKQTKYCGAPGCTYAVIYPSMIQADIICKCGKDFCFKCTKDAHRPLECEQFASW